MKVLRSFSMFEAIDFIFYLEDKEMDEQRFKQYLQTDMSLSFDDFKAEQRYKSIRRRKEEVSFTAEDEQASLDFASQFIKPKEGR